jgi:hypothetical protein
MCRGGRGGVGRVGVGVGCSVRARVAGVVLLVLELAFESVWLPWSCCALNPLDILIIGGQDGLQLQLEGVRLHFGVCINHGALVLKCSCIDAAIEKIGI